MMKSLIFAAIAFSAAALLVTGCGNKTEPKSVSTTSTQTTTNNEAGGSTTTNVKTKTTEMPDGSKSVETTQKTSTNVPAAAPGN